MCDIVGIRSPHITDYDADTIQSMVSCLSHRGPDNLGIHSIPEDHISLGHTRLAIIDFSYDLISETRHQYKSLNIFSSQFYDQHNMSKIPWDIASLILWLNTL